MIFDTWLTVDTGHIVQLFIRVLFGTSPPPAAGN